MDRREFLGLLTLASGASLLAGCDLTRKSEKLIPYLVPPDDGIIPGEATYVATSCTECPAHCGITARFDLFKPVIAAVNGLALGGGFELALAADLVVAAEHADFRLPETGLGIIPDSGGVLWLPRRLPRPVAVELLLTGRTMTAAEAGDRGLVNQVVPGDQLMPAARALAARVIRSAPLAVAAVLEVLDATEAGSVPDGFGALRSGRLARYAAMLASEDAAEGPAAFAAQRPANWKGR